MAKKIIHRTVIEVEVLSEQPIPDTDSLEFIAREIIHGDWSGKWGVTGEHELSGTEAVEAIQNQGSDPQFFGIDENGDDLDEEEG
ncbi:MAG: hypothetical protein CMG78_12145 [Marinobacter sp.]|nr:hypothetical protein [Marinobacter sp.]|tara:strand:- start:993 stop:1247 length:255 start_codon:yes stop_codon:yes gene_type:complete